MSVSATGKFLYPDTVRELLTLLSKFPGSVQTNHSAVRVASDFMFCITTWNEFSWHMNCHNKGPAPPEYAHVQIVPTEFSRGKYDKRHSDLYCFNGDTFPGTWEGMQRYMHSQGGDWCIDDPLRDDIYNLATTCAKKCRGMLEKIYGKTTLYWDNDAQHSVRSPVAPQLIRARRTLLYDNIFQCIYNTILTHGTFGPEAQHPYAKVLPLLRQGFIPAGWSGDFYHGKVGVLDIWSTTLDEAPSAPAVVADIAPPGDDAGIVMVPHEVHTFGRAVERHRQHLMPYALIPGRMIAPDVTGWVPWVIPYEPEDGMIGDQREAHHRGLLQRNWLSFVLDHGKLRLDGSFAFFAAEPDGDEDVDHDLQAHIAQVERHYQDLSTRVRGMRPVRGSDGSWMVPGTPALSIFTRLGGPVPGGNWVDVAPRVLRVADDGHGPVPHDQNGTPWDPIGYVDHQLIPCRMLGFLNRSRDRVLFTFDWS